MTYDPESTALPMARRRFLTVAGGTAGALALGACSWRDGIEASVARTTTSTTTPPGPVTEPGTDAGDEGKPLLVVVNLSGGNDGLNTVVPLTGRYHDLRPAVGLEQSTLEPLTADFGLHPDLAPLLPWWERGSMAALYGVGLRGQSRSHFAATDTWAMGSADGDGTGWLGRWLDLHPDAGADPLIAVGLGGGRAAVRGTTASSTVIQRPDQFLLTTAPGLDADRLAEVLLATSAPAADDGDAMTMVRAGIPRATNAVRILEEIGDDLGSSGLEPSSASGLLQVAARLVELNLSTEIITIDVGGFDTHANQLPTHAALLDDLATGLAAFLDAVDAHQTPRRVLVMTTSEFGRRAADNGGGTDHGAANVHVLIGDGVHGGRVVGDPGLDSLVDGDLPISIDTRSLYGAALHWMGGPVDDVLDGSWDTFGLV